MQVFHTLEPIYDCNSTILILGSIPSIISRKNNFYYAYKQNRFWKVLESIYNTKLDSNIERINFLHENHIALWDTIYSCDIDSSKDNSIKNIKVNDIKSILDKTKIKYIYCTGKTSYNIYNKYIYNSTHIEAFYLPSTSSANGRYKLNNLIKEYKIIKEKQ